MPWTRPFINAGLPKTNWSIIRTAGRNICRSNTQNDWQKRRLPRPSAVSEIPMTMHWQKRSTACSKPRSFTGAGHGAASMLWNTPRSKGWIGSTLAAYWSLSGTSHKPKPRQTSTLLWKDQTWLRNQDKSASNKPGPVQSQRP